jgi:hypothetical protein
MYLARLTHKNNLHINEQLNQYPSEFAHSHQKTTSTGTNPTAELGA